MKECPECHAPLPAHDATFCVKCGASLGSSGKGGDSDGKDDLDFVVTEATASGPEFVGGDNPTSNEGPDIEIESNSDLMDQEARGTDNQQQSSEAMKDTPAQPIGSYEPPPPPIAAGVDASTGEQASESSSSDVSESGRSQSETTASAKSDPRPPEPGMGDNGPYLSDREKEELIRKIDAANRSSAAEADTKAEVPAPKEPSADPQYELPKPHMASRGKGIAYFYRNFIQVAGSQGLRAEDEMTINDRVYELKPKTISSGVLIGSGIGVFVLLLIIVGSLLVSQPDRSGDVFGIVLDEAGQPYVQGATIHFPELGGSTTSTPQGFFRAEGLPVGTHRLEYKVDGEVVGAEYATVADGRLTMVTLSPDEPEEPVVEEPTAEEIAASEAAEAAAKARRAETPKKKTQESSKKPKYAKLALAANVDGARLSLDGSVLGAGSLTYSNLTPGNHEYTVKADGYKTAGGTVKLTAGRTATLKVALTPLTQEQIEASYGAEDFYSVGVAHLQEGEAEAAIDYLTQAVDEQPSFAEAYKARGDAYAAQSSRAFAHDDYVRAAEIFRVRKEYNDAITAYNNAIEMDGKSLTAFLGRADLYLAKGEEIAAIADFEEALDIDDKTASAHFGLGEARFQQGNYKKAIKHFKKARSLNPENPLVHQYLMLSYLARDDVKEVRKSYEKFTEVASPSDIERLHTDKRYSGIIEALEEDK